MCELVWDLLGKVLKKKLGSDKTPPFLGEPAAGCGEGMKERAGKEEIKKDR